MICQIFLKNRECKGEFKMFYVRLSALFVLFLTLYLILTGSMKDFTENIEETNKITLSKDGKGGWYYQQESGVIEPNLP